MEKFKEVLFNWKQPQLASLFLTVLIVLVLSLLIYFKVKKTNPQKASKGIVLIAEAYVGSIEKTYEAVSGPQDNLKLAKFYILSLGTFLLIGNGVVIFGFEPIVTSFSVPFTLAILTWLGVLVIGTMYSKWRFYAKLLIPTELIGKVSILVSLSFRIYGNIIGGAAILAMAYVSGGILWQKIFSVEYGNDLYFFSLIITPFFHFYFDIFGSTLQAFIFALLTSVYWVSEAGDVKPKKQTTSRKLSFRDWTRRKTQAIY